MDIENTYFMDNEGYFHFQFLSLHISQMLKMCIFTAIENAYFLVVSTAKYQSYAISLTSTCHWLYLDLDKSIC